MDLRLLLPLNYGPWFDLKAAGNGGVPQEAAVRQEVVLAGACSVVDVLGTGHTVVLLRLRTLRPADPI